MAEGQPETRADKGRMFWGAIFVVFVLLLVYIFATSGFVGVSDIIKRLITYALILVAVGLVVWAVLKFFQKTPVDLVANDRKDIIDAGMLSKPPMVNDLYFTGDKEHGEFRVGTIIGYCQLQSYKDLDLISNLTDDQIDQLEKQGKIPSDMIIKEDCFIFKRLPFPMSLFEQPKVLRTLENEHSQLIGDVKVYGVSMISKFSYYWPNRAHLDIVRIDIGVIREAWRGLIHQYRRPGLRFTRTDVQTIATRKIDEGNVEGTQSGLSERFRPEFIPSLDESGEPARQS